MITRSDNAVDPARRRAVLFDFDGTLADTKPAIVETASAVLTDFGIPAAEVAAKVGDLIGPPFPDAFSSVFGLTAADASEVTRRYRSIYFKLGADAWPFFDGIAELLAHLRANGRLVAAASSKRQEMTERGIADNGAAKMFDAIVGKVDGVCDTKSEAIAGALEELGVAADDAVMVGDRSYDVLGAADVGLACIGVLFGNTGTRTELERAGAIAVVDTVAELEELLLPTAEARGGLKRGDG